MGNLTPRSNLAVLAAVLAAGACGLAQAQQVVSLDKCEDPRITLKSEKQATFNLRDKAVELGKVDITACGARIRANNAVTTSADFEDSTWTFEGDVRIDIDREQGTLTSDKAIVIFKNNQLNEATITGSPAEFEHKRGNVNTRGSAGRIIYDLASQNVRLVDDARVTDGGRLDVKAATLAYNLRTQDLDVAGKGSGKGYTLVIDPRLAKKKSDEKADEKKPEDKPPTPSPQ